MRQRVGFARALSVEPDALLMDEPFSVLDVPTAANLRGELTRLCEGKEFPVKAVLIVTHNIEEAVQLADRILVLSCNPGRILAELPVPLPPPPRPADPWFRAARGQRLRHPDRPRGSRRAGRGVPGCRGRNPGRRAAPLRSPRAGFPAAGNPGRAGRAGRAGRTGRRPELRDRRPAPAGGRGRPAQPGPGAQRAAGDHRHRPGVCPGRHRHQQEDLR